MEEMEKMEVTGDMEDFMDIKDSEKTEDMEHAKGFLAYLKSGGKIKHGGNGGRREHRGLKAKVDIKIIIIKTINY